jgi:phosphotriesterase-related protein
MSAVMSVGGLVQKANLGLVLPHEHLFVDLSCYCPPQPAGEKQQAFFRKEVSLAERDLVVNDPWGNLDNTQLMNLQTACDEAGRFAASGGRTIVELSATPAMGRNPHGLSQVAEKTGLNVIMAAGRYTLPSLSDDEKQMNVEDVADHLLDEFIHGINGIRPGLLKAGFVSKIDAEPEIRSLRAVARVQRKVGCALAIHPYIWEPLSHKILDILEEEGCDLRRVILCHQDILGNMTDYLDSLVQRGVYIEFDTFGCGWINDPMWQQTDAQKIGYLKNQIDLGNNMQLLISGDICLKIMLTRYGGAGYAHLPQMVLPALKEAGFNENIIWQISVENPARVLCH